MRYAAQDAARKGWLRHTPLGAVDTRVVASVMADVAGGMAALHAAGVVHGDLSGGARLPQAWGRAVPELRGAMPTRRPAWPARQGARGAGVYRQRGASQPGRPLSAV